MAVDPTVYQSGDVVNLAAAAAVKVGQLVYWDSTNSRVALADADTMTTPAEWVVVKGRATANGDIVGVSKWAIFDDADLTLTLTTGHSYNPIFLSATAGSLTQTRPTAAGSLVQIIGKPFSATRYIINIKDPYEVVIPGELLESTSGEAALGSRTALDTGLFEGQQLNASTEYVLYGFYIPAGAIKLLKADLVNSEETATSEVYSFTVNGAIHDASWDTVTADTSESAKDITLSGTADDISFYDAVAAFDATNIFRPNSYVVCKVSHDAIGTGATLIFGMHLTALCV